MQPYNGSFTAYCALASGLRERRVAARFDRYRAAVLYMLPDLTKDRPDAQ